MKTGYPGTPAGGSTPRGNRNAHDTVVPAGPGESQRAAQAGDAAGSAPSAPPWQKDWGPPQENARLATLKAMRHSCNATERRAIATLETLEQRSGRNLTNERILPHADYVNRNRPEVRAALKRTASFLLVRDVLRDVVDGLPAVMDLDDHPDTAPRVGALVNAQLEALRRHVDASMAATRDKLRTGQRILPFAMHSQAFDQFMQAHGPTLRRIVDTCRQVGVQRTYALEHYLKTLARNYLGAMNRQPRGVTGTRYCEFLGLRYENDCIALRLIDYEIARGTAYDAENGGNFGMMLVDPEGCTQPFNNPSEGSLEEQFYSTGFEHCSIPEKQAAVMILKTFWEVIYLEELVAQLKGKASKNRTEARLAQASKRDFQYSGCVETGDFFDELGIDPANQRKGLIDAVRVLAAAVKAHDARTGTALVDDPDLDTWLQSPQFEKDMDGLAIPELRNWLLGSASVKEALLRTSVFARQ